MQLLVSLKEIYEYISVTQLIYLNIAILLIVIVLVLIVLTKNQGEAPKELIEEYKPIIEETTEEKEDKALEKISQMLEEKTNNNPIRTFEEEQENTAIISYNELMRDPNLEEKKQVEEIPLTKVILPSSEELPTSDNIRREAINELFSRPPEIKKTNTDKHEDFLSDLKSLKSRLK